MKHPPSIVRRCAAVPWMLAFVLALPVALMPSQAHGQGTSGMLPDPISSRDLARYADRLDLTELQRLRIEPFHEQYRAEFRQLREGDIEAFLQQMAGMRGGMFRMFDRSAIEDSLSKLNRVMSKIRAIDNHLFGQIQTVLSDEQTVVLPRVKQARERQRYSSGATRYVGFVNQAARVDLSRQYDELELTAEQREVTDPFMVQYEGRLTTSAKGLYEATTRILLDVVDALEEQGFGLDNFAEGADRRQMMQVMMTAWAEAIKKPREKASAISDLNRRTLRQVTELLPHETAATLRDRYLRRAYPEVPPTRRGIGETAYRAALRLTGLSETMRQDVEAAAVQFRSSRTNIINEMLNAIDEYRRDFSPFDYRSGKRQEHQDKLEEYRQRLGDLDETAVETLYALLGPERAEGLKAAVAKRKSRDDDRGEREETTVTMVGGGGMGAMRIGQVSGSDAAGLGPDPFLPQPISRRDITLYGKRLQLGENDRLILETLHEDYLTSYSRITSTDIQALHAAQAKLWQFDAQADRMNAPAPEQIDEVFTLRRRALKSIRELDGSFFADLETLLASEEQSPMVQRLRMARERAVYNRGASEGGPGQIISRRGRRGRPSFIRGFGRQSQESSVDVASLLDDLGLSDQDRAKVDELLVEYEAKATDAFRRQYEHAIRLNQEREKLTAASSRPTGEGGRSVAVTLGEDFRRVMEDYGRKAREAGTVIVELNRATLSTLSETLDGKTAAALRNAYNRKAFPGTYNDPQAAERYLTTALKLPNLSDDQSAKVESILQEYQPAYLQLSDRMTEIHAASPDTGGRFDPAFWRSYQERRNKLEMLEFDRDEVNAKALRQLREVLTEQQKARIGLRDEEDLASDNDPDRPF